MICPLRIRGDTTTYRDGLDNEIYFSVVILERRSDLQRKKSSVIDTVIVI